jgi:hypothetical protein
LRARVGNDLTYLLRPAVALGLTEDMTAGKGKKRMMMAAKKSQLLLIVGVSLKVQPLLALTSDLAEIIHERSGAVIYVHPEPLKGNNMFTHIDAQLSLDSAGIATRVMEEIGKVRLPACGPPLLGFLTRDSCGPLQVPAPAEGDVPAEYNGDDFWFDVSNPVPRLALRLNQLRRAARRSITKSRRRFALQSACTMVACASGAAAPFTST